jgi:hypothetical protein
VKQLKQYFSDVGKRILQIILFILILVLTAVIMISFILLGVLYLIMLPAVWILFGKDGINKMKEFIKRIDHTVSNLIDRATGFIYRIKGEPAD